MTRPLCFVMLPFKPVVLRNRRVNFPAVYASIIAPAIEMAGMVSLRADEDPESRGVFQKTMFERLVLCEYAVADLTYGNPNVYYELGVRHGLRPYSTVLLFREDWALPLDLAHDAAERYAVDASGEPVEIDRTRARLAARLQSAKTARIDSPVYQLVSGLPVPEIDHARIDSFRDHADRDESLRRKLDSATHEGVEAVRAVEESLGRLQDLDIRAAIALLLAYRSLSAFEDLVRLVEGVAPPIRAVELVQQQYAWALNRAGNDSEAEHVAKQLVAARPSSESFGLLGRIYTDRWRKAQGSSRRRGFLRAAIDAYLRGFEVDWRDPYPGINAVSLMAKSRPPDPRLEKYLPIVDFANERRLTDRATEADYWDHATDLGLAVLRRDRPRASRALEAMLSSKHNRWQSETTAQGLQELCDALSENEDVAWIEAMLDELRGD